MKLHMLAVAGGLVAVAASLGAQMPAYKRDVPMALAKQARVSEAAAAATARRLVPAAHIDALELERENGHLIYSFDMKTPGRDGIDEANIDAMTGKQVGKIGHESGADEANETAAERKPAYKRDVPMALAKQARVSEAAAAATARRLVPNARIDALELERENGHLIYSFEMKTPGRDGIDEANIDAMTGKQVGKIGHESGGGSTR